MNDEELAKQARQAVVHVIQRMLMEETQPIVRFQKLLSMAEGAANIYMKEHPEETDEAAVQVAFLSDIMDSTRTAMVGLAEQAGDESMAAQLRAAEFAFSKEDAELGRIFGVQRADGSSPGAEQRNQGIEKLFKLNGFGDPGANN